MSEHAQVVGLLADILAAQRDNTESITKLAEALAGIRTQVVAAKAETAKAIDKAKIEPAAPAQAATPTPTASEAPSAAPMTYKADVAPTMAKLLSTKGAPAVVELLATFGVKKGADLQPAQLPAALAAANALLAA